MHFAWLLMIILLGGSEVLLSVKGDERVSCTEYETQCHFGCCPYADAECCADGYECCQHGQVCIPYIGICIGVQSNSDGNATLHSQRTSALRSVEPCPNGTTSCTTGCCPFPGGVCCSDNVNCCPNGFRCSASACVSNDNSTNPFLVGRIERPLQNRQGLRDLYNVEDNAIATNPFLVGRIKRPLQNRQGLRDLYNIEGNATALSSPVLSLKTCPDGKRQCPNGSSCCIGDDEEWNCCPASPRSGGECCNTEYGWVCCIDLIPKCYYFGCWWW